MHILSLSVSLKHTSDILGLFKGSQTLQDLSKCIKTDWYEQVWRLTSISNGHHKGVLMSICVMRFLKEVGKQLIFKIINTLQKGSFNMLPVKHILHKTSFYNSISGFAREICQNTFYYKELCIEAFKFKLCSLLLFCFLFILGHAFVFMQRLCTFLI